MKINIVAGGPPDLIPGLGQYDGDTVVWVGVDRGVYYLLQAGIRPARAFGDFDSVSDEEWAEIQKEVAELAAFQPEKDETDMELALNWALGQMPESISVFGATGGRLDHMLANVQLLLKPLENETRIPIEIIDERNILYAKKPGSYTVNRIKDLKYISFLPDRKSVV